MSGQPRATSQPSTRPLRRGEGERTSQLSERPPSRPSALDLLLIGDWVLPIRVALLAAIAGIAIIASILAVTLFAGLLADPSSFRDSWSSAPGADIGARAFLLGLIVAWVAGQGGLGLTTVTLTGLVWAGLSVAIAFHIIDPPPVRKSTTIWRTSLKVGVVHGAVALVAALIVGSVSLESLVGFAGGSAGVPGLSDFSGAVRPFGSVVTPLGALFGAAVVGMAGSTIALARRSGIGAFEVLGVREPSDLARGALRGGVAALKLAVVVMVLVIVVGIAVAAARVESGPGDLLGIGGGVASVVVPVVVISVLLGGLDMGLLGNAGALLLLLPGTDLVDSFRSGGGSVPGWLYLSLVIPSVAAFHGGQTAAKEARARDRTEATRVGAASGITVAVVLLVWSSLFATRIGGSFVLSATGWSLLWFVGFGAIGGFIFADRAGLPDHVPASGPRRPQAASQQRMRPVARAEPQPRAPVGDDGVTRRVEAAGTAASAVEPVRMVPTAQEQRTIDDGATSRREPVVEAGHQSAELRESRVAPREILSEMDVLAGTSAGPTASWGGSHDVGVPHARPSSDGLEEVSSGAAAQAPGEGAIVPTDVTCPGCNSDNPSGSKYCGFCGHVMPELVRACDRCGEVHPLDLRFCRSCGGPLS